MPTGESARGKTASLGHRPEVGELWRMACTGRHAIHLGGSLWNVLASNNDEYTLQQVAGLEPLHRCPEQPAGFHWADQFDSLAAADGLRITWAEEILTYQAQGWDKVRKLPLLNR